MNAVLALASKDVLLLLRDPTGFVVTFVSPLIYAVFFGLVFGGRLGSLDSSRVTITAVDEDGTKSSRTVIEALKGCPGFDVELAERTPALEAFRRGEVPVCVIIPTGFERRARLKDGAEPSMIEVAIRSDQLHLRHLFRRDTPDFLFVGADCPTADLASAAQDDPTASRLPANTEGHVSASAARTAPDNVYAVAFPQGMTWGVLGCTAAFGLSLVVERNRGTLLRLRLAPITRTQILAGKAGACFSTSLLLGIALFALSRIVFGVRPGSLGLLMLALLSVSIAFVGIMMFLSVWGKTEQAASSIIWTVLLGMSMLGGGMVPRFFMPSSLQRLGDLSPIRWAIFAMEGAIWRGFTLGEMVQPCGILIAVGLSCFALGVISFRWSD